MSARENWSNKGVFIMAAIGSAVGLGNLWRFPYIAYKNGGGAFLIPYFIALLTTGVPLMILEFGVGFLKRGAAPAAMKKIRSRYEWIGWWGVLCGLVIVIYYMAVMAWSCVYLYNSFQVKWSGTESAFFYNKILDLSPTKTTAKLKLKKEEINITIPALGQDENLKNKFLKVKLSNLDLKKIKSKKSYEMEIPVKKDKIVLQLTNFETVSEDEKNSTIKFPIENSVIEKMNEAGLFNPFQQVTRLVWPLVFGLLVAWILVYLIIVAGVERVGKIVIWTVPLPLILLLVILIEGLLQPGAMDGIRHYLTPDFNILSNPDVWLAAYSQIFFSLSIGFGILIAYASYLPKESAEITNSAFLTSFANCATSFFAGFAVFSIIGYLAVLTNTDIATTVKSGPGLAFVVFPTALAKLPGISAPIFSVLFFITLLSLGIDSAFSLVEAIVAAITDKVENKIRRRTIVRVTCVLGFLAGLIFVSRAGLYWLDVVDNWMNKYGLALVGLAECIIIGYMVNTKMFRKEINEHSDFKINAIWDVCIKYITPAVLIFLIGANILKEIRSPYEGYPSWMLNTGGWGISVFLIFMALFLMESKNKWPYKGIIAFFTIVISLIAMGYQVAGMFIFGCVFLFGGVIYFLRIALRKKSSS